MFAVGCAATSVALPKAVARSQKQQPRRSVVPRAVSEQQAALSIEKLQHDLQAATQQRDYWRSRCMEAEDKLTKLKKKYDNEHAHDHPDAKAAATARKEDLHLGQKRQLLPEDDNKGRRDM